ncbi:MAG: hypothetical protein LBV16_03465 [Elusimicrobiota bacterium]|nr:hypothetical protein [Elusimicrobiota bacterium]
MKKIICFIVIVLWACGAYGNSKFILMDKPQRPFPNGITVVIAQELDKENLTVLIGGEQYFVISKGKLFPEKGMVENIFKIIPAVISAWENGIKSPIDVMPARAIWVKRENALYTFDSMKKAEDFVRNRIMELKSTAAPKP